MRTFVAVELPEAIRAALKRAMAPLRSSVEADLVRWTRLEAIHLTLKFLGEIQEVQVGSVTQALDEVADRAAPFNLEVGSFGCFPKLSKPRVMWIGVKDEGDQLAQTQAELEHRLERLGFEREQRPYHPHLTIGRTHKGLSNSEVNALGKWAAATTIDAIGVLEVSSFSLIRSDLKPTGPVYTRLHRSNLTP